LYFAAWSFAPAKDVRMLPLVDRILFLQTLAMHFLTYQLIYRTKLPIMKYYEQS